MKLRTSNKLLSNSNISGVNDNDPFFFLKATYYFKKTSEKERTCVF